MKGRLDTFSRFSAFKIHNSVSLWVKKTRKPNGIGHTSWCFARKQSSNSATGCDVINRWIIGTRNKYRALLESWAPPCILGSLSKDVFERPTSTGSEAFLLFICVNAKKFAFLSFFSLIKTFYPRVSTKPLPSDTKSPLPVAVRRSKTLLLISSLRRTFYIQKCLHMSLLYLAIFLYT